MKTKLLNGALFLAFVAALTGCYKDSLREPYSGKSPESFTLKEAKAFIDKNGPVVAPGQGATKAGHSLYVTWSRAEFTIQDSIIIWYVPLQQNLLGVPLKSSVCSCEEGACDCSTCACEHGGEEGCGHLNASEEPVASSFSTLFLRKDLREGSVVAYVQTNEASPDGVRYAYYSALSGQVFNSSLAFDGTANLIGETRAARDSVFCYFCNTYDNCTKCHNCLRPFTFCVCYGQGNGGYCEFCQTTPCTRCHYCLKQLAYCDCGIEPGTPGILCPLCGAYGDPRCLTPADQCVGMRCNLCNKLFSVPWLWNVAYHYREHCRAEGFCMCANCPRCGMHPSQCACCPTCQHYPCICMGDDSTR